MSSKFKRRAKGTYQGHRTPRICIGFEQNLFDRINDYAEESKLSFSETVRSLIEYAFDRLSDEEAKDSTPPFTRGGPFS